MDIHQLRTFVAVAREGSITRASTKLYLSQPAVSAHIKTLEEILDLTLFDRTARGMDLTGAGMRLLARAEQTLSAHRRLVEEAARIKGGLSGRLRLGGGANSAAPMVDELIRILTERYPEVSVELQHDNSTKILSGIRDGKLDAGIYNEPDEPGDDLVAIELSRFAVYLAAPPGTMTDGESPDWQALGEMTWIYPSMSSCCSRAAEHLFRRYQFRPRHVISVDRESVTRKLIADGVGIGLLHVDVNLTTQSNDVLALICQAGDLVRSLFVYSAERSQDPLLNSVADILRENIAPIEKKSLPWSP